MINTSASPSIPRYTSVVSETVDMNITKRIICFGCKQPYNNMRYVNTINSILNRTNTFSSPFNKDTTFYFKLETNRLPLNESNILIHD